LHPGAHSGAAALSPIKQSPDKALLAAFADSGCHMHARLLAALRLEEEDGGTLELSGLAWSRDEQLLYAIGDEGILLWLRPRFAGDGRLAAITGRKLLPLRDAQGWALQGDDSDSEGLALRYGADGTAGNDELLISFERRMRICRYSPLGEFRGCETLPASLADARRYRGSNRGLEAVALHPRFGVLTGPERPLRGSGQTQRLSVYSLDGRDWGLPAQRDQASLVDMSVLPGGGLLLLERNRIGMLGLRLQTVVHLAPDLAERPQWSRQLLRMDSRAFPIGNLEGIAAQDERRFFLVSDDNGPLLAGKTQLLHVEWAVPPPAGCPTR